jgi:hypothetical protein
VAETYVAAEGVENVTSFSELPTLRESNWTQADALQSQRWRVCVTVFEFFPL